MRQLSLVATISETEKQYRRSLIGKRWVLQ